MLAPKFDFPEVKQVEIVGLKFKGRLELSLDCSLDEGGTAVAFIPSLFVEIFDEDGQVDPAFSKTYQFEDTIDLASIFPKDPAVDVGLRDIFFAPDPWNNELFLDNLARVVMNLAVTTAKIEVEIRPDTSSVDFYLTMGPYKSKASAPIKDLGRYLASPRLEVFGDVVWA